MRLINTSTRLFEDFITRNIPAYAILSHTWRNDEVTYKDYMEGRYATMDGFEKIDVTCQLAKRAGIQYCWIDTCCIDKSSSAELTEAINSMYAWYNNAYKCYTCLDDLIPGVDVGVELSKCRWFTRGWTLQELIAPRKVEIYDREWNRIGAKNQLATPLSTITSIEEGILRKEYELDFVPVAVRMSWAAKRQTTRVEDTAYCLLGIFNVNLPLLYGEQEKAFQRLQEEIVRSTPDLSIFAWSYRFTLEPHNAQNMLSAALAESPADFEDCRLIKLMHQTDRREVAFTNIGIRTRLRILLHKESGYVLPLNCYSTVTGRSLGVKLCKVGREQYLRQDPCRLLEYATGTFEDRKSVERYLLTSIPPNSWPHHNPNFTRFQPRFIIPTLLRNRICITLPSCVEILDVWPSDCWDDALQTFFIAGDPRWDSFQMKLKIKHETKDGEGKSLDMDFEFVLYALGWSNTTGGITNVNTFGLVDYQQYRNEVDKAHRLMKEKDANTAMISRFFETIKMPKTSYITFRIPGTLRSLVLRVKARLRQNGWYEYQMTTNCYVGLFVEELQIKDIELHVPQRWQVYND